ncbi:MAG: hypothetical protein ACHRXM_39890, partial [Isosphaerales bacterium]
IFGLCLLGIVLLADWPYMHEHHFLPLALWWGVMTATVGVNLQQECRPSIPTLVTIGAVIGILFCLANVASDIVSTTTIVDRVQLKRAILTRINKPDRVLFGAALHPISALDASYYNIPIADCPGRLATAVRLAQARRPLPDCDYIADIRANRPALIDQGLLYCLENTERQAFKELLTDYDEVSIKAHPRSSLLCILYVLKSPVLVPRNIPPSVPTSRVRSVNAQPDRRVMLPSSSDRIGPSLQRIPR